MTVIDFVMPSLGADMDSGTITEWMIGPGDVVDRGDVVAIVETDKADIDIEVWDSGRVTEIVIPVGENVSVGTPLARIEVVEEAATSTVRPDEQPHEAAASPAEHAEEVEAVAAPAKAIVGAGDGTAIDAFRGDRPLASPLARRLAAAQGLALASVAGTGPGGAVVARDLVRSLPDSRPEPTVPEGNGGAPVADRALDGAARMRKAIADLMARSKREIPHYYLETDVDLEAASVWLESYNSTLSVGQRVLPAALIMKAMATAMVDHPEFNGFWIDDEFRPGDGVQLGVAVSLRGGGLVAPAIHHADRLTVADLMVALRDLVGRSRSGRLRASEMTDATVTVTNLGDRGVEVVHGVIYPPQVALIGVGRIAAKPTVVDGDVVARRRVRITLAADHRASDGQRGARLLNTISRLLQKPEDL